MQPTTQQEQTYESIMKLYDLAEGVIDVVEYGGVKEPRAYVPLVEELIDQVERSTEVLAEAYIMFVETGSKPNPDQKKKVEAALRKIFVSIDKFRNAANTIN